MADPFENDEWVEISDDNGRKTALRHLATIHHGDSTYFVLGTVNEDDDGRQRGALMLVREEETRDGSPTYVLEQNRDEIEHVINDFVIQMILDHIDEGFDEEAMLCPCGMHHGALDFCFCNQPEYLQ